MNSSAMLINENYKTGFRVLEILPFFYKGRWLSDTFFSREDGWVSEEVLLTHPARWIGICN